MYDSKTVPHIHIFCDEDIMFQIIDELLDIEKNPRKPQYTMASGEYPVLSLRIKVFSLHTIAISVCIRIILLGSTLSAIVTLEAFYF